MSLVGQKSPKTKASRSGSYTPETGSYGDFGLGNLALPSIADQVRRRRG